MFGGPPRWLGYDYTQFVPNINTGQIGISTAEKAVQAAQGKGGAPGQQPGGPVTPGHLPGEQPVGQPVPKFGTLAQPQPLGGQPSGGPGGGAGGPQADVNAGIAAGLQAGAGAPPPPAPEPAPPAPTQSPLDLLHAFTLDEGGWLMPGMLGSNTTGRPELVLSPQQLDAALAPSGGSRNPYNRGGDTYHITAVDAHDVAKEIDKRKRLAMMQYSGRP
jgi:hypothetical protein